MAIKLNPDVWGSIDRIILSNQTDQKHTQVYYPYYVASDEFYNTHPTNIVSLRSALNNAKNNKEQSTQNEYLDYTVCSWSINSDAAINNIYYYASYYDKSTDAYISDMCSVSINDATAYPAFFVQGLKQEFNVYTVLNNIVQLKDSYNYNVDFKSDFFRDVIGSTPPTVYNTNSPILSFGYKSPLYFVLVNVCTEDYFYNTSTWGGINYKVPTNVDNSVTYLMSLYDYYNATIIVDGVTKKINEVYNVTLAVMLNEYIDTKYTADNTESDDPSRVGNGKKIEPMPAIKMRSFKDVEPTSIFGANNTPWYNWNNIYQHIYGRLILGMSYATGSRNEYTVLKNKTINTAEKCLAYWTRQNVDSQINIPCYIKSNKPNLTAKEIFGIIRNSKSDPMYRFGYMGLTEEEILSEIAYLGLWFSSLPANNNTVNINLYSVCNGDNVTGYNLYEYYMPIFDEHMVTTGKYISANEINKNPEELAKQYPNIKWGWRFNLAPDYEYDPDYRPPKPDDDDKYEDRQTDKGSLSTSYHNNSRVNGYTAYVLSGKGLNTIKNAINSQLKPPADVTADDWFKLDWYGQDPGSFILATNKFPCDVNVSTLADQIVTIGRTILYTSGDSPTALHAPGAIFQVGTLDFGTLQIAPYYNDFRDYAPYSNYIVHIPYFADYTLDPKIWLNHTCKIKIDYDIVTCNAMAEIWRDDMWYDTIYGTFGTPVPFLTYNAGNYQNAVVNAQANLESSKNAMTQSFLSTATSIVGTGVSIATGNIPLAIGSGVGLVNSASRSVDAYNRVQVSEYNLKHTAPNPTGTSGVGGVTALTTRNYCTLIISRPQPLHYNKAMYGKTIGFACCETGKLSNYHGLTVCSNTRFNSFTGTQSELAEIQQLLNSGVILP